MRRSIVFVLAAVLACAVPSGAARAHEDAAPAAAAAAAPAGVSAELLKGLKSAESEIVELAEAMPADKYGWRPAEGVRSVAEVYLHVAGGNYMLPSFMGAKIPEGVDYRTIEKSTTDKAEIVKALKASFAHAEQVIATTPESDYGRAVKLFGGDGTVLETLMIVITHAHEHLGQSIAYARMNGVVPPWTARQEAARKAKAEKPKE